MADMCSALLCLWRCIFYQHSFSRIFKISVKSKCEQLFSYKIFGIIKKIINEEVFVYVAKK